MRLSYTCEASQRCASSSAHLQICSSSSDSMRSRSSAQVSSTRTGVHPPEYSIAPFSVPGVVPPLTKIHSKRVSWAGYCYDRRHSGESYLFSSVALNSRWGSPHCSVQSFGYPIARHVNWLFTTDPWGLVVRLRSRQNATEVPKSQIVRRVGALATPCRRLGVPTPFLLCLPSRIGSLADPGAASAKPNTSPRLALAVVPSPAGTLCCPRVHPK